MTKITKVRLEKELATTRQKVVNLGKRIGETAGENCDWHDNFAFDEATRDYQFHLGIVQTLEEKLSKAEIIKPRKETDQVGIGNSVIIKFKKEEEKFTILGSEDSRTNKEWISYQTPVAKSLLGKSEGNTVLIKTPDGERRIEIIKILPGDFE